MWEEPEDGLFHCSANDHRQAHGSQADRYQGEAATADARVDFRYGRMAAVGGEGVFPILCDPGNEAKLKTFRQDVLRLWLCQLRRRSQRSRWTWQRFLQSLGVLLPEVHILHPYPEARFDAKHPR